MALALPVALLGCGKSGNEAGPASTATAEAVKAPAATVAAPTASPTADRGRDRLRGRRGGIAGMMVHAAQGLDLKDAQKATVAQLMDQARAVGDAPSAQAKEYHAAVAAQVRAGKIETAKLDVLQAAMDKSTAAHKEKEDEVLNGLYAALEPAQRKTLATQMRAKQAERMAKGAERRAETAKLTDADRAKRRLDHLTKQLGLDAGQQKAVAAALAKAPPAAEDAARDDMNKRTDAILTAFDADGFDAKKVDAAPAPGAKKGPMAEHAQFLAVVVPLLKPDQRERLAVSLEKPGGARRGEGSGDEAPVEEAPSAP